MNKIVFLILLFSMLFSASIAQEASSEDNAVANTGRQDTSEAKDESDENDDDDEEPDC